MKTGEFAEKKRMPGERAEDAGLSVVEEVRRYMVKLWTALNLKLKLGLPACIV